MKLLSILLTSSLLCLSLNAADSRKLFYEISYLGIPLLDMTMTWTEDDSSVNVSYDNQLKPLISFIHPLHNVYQVRFLKESYKPLNWSRQISEGSMHFKSHVSRLDEETIEVDSSQQMSFPATAFTVFSATHYLASRAGDPNAFPMNIEVFIDGEIWEAKASRFDRRHPHPNHETQGDQVLIQTELRHLSGSSYLSQNDVLTSVIAREGTQFVLWVNARGTFTKAQFGSFPKSVILELRKN